MKSFILVALLFLASAVSFGQLRDYGANSRVYRLLEGDYMTMVSSNTDTAMDNATYLHKAATDLGGRVVIYGMNTLVECDTVTTNLVLEGSIDDTTYTGIDSLAVSTAHVVGKKFKTVDLANFRYPFWRLRYGAGSLNLRGNKVPTGQLYFFILTNYKNRF